MSIHYWSECYREVFVIRSSDGSHLVSDAKLGTRKEKVTKVMLNIDIEEVGRMLKEPERYKDLQ